MQCAMCKRNINPDDGYFTSLVNNIRQDFHPSCKPVLFFQNGKQPGQQELFKENSHEKLS